MKIVRNNSFTPMGWHRPKYMRREKWLKKMSLILNQEPDPKKTLDENISIFQNRLLREDLEKVWKSFKTLDWRNGRIE